MCLAVPGRVIHIEQVDGVRMGKVDFGGVVKNVCLDYVPELELGDYTIVHVGFALSRIDEAAARETLQLLAESGLLADELEPDAATLDDDLPPPRQAPP